MSTTPSHNEAAVPELDRLLAQPQLTPTDVVAARGLISQLHALSAVVTRTRKNEIQEHKAIREARPIDVELTALERELYDMIDAWQRARAKEKSKIGRAHG